MRKCLKPDCSRGRAQGDAFCSIHWNEIPQTMRDAYWATRPHSNERRGALLEVTRWLLKNGSAS